MAQSINGQIYKAAMLKQIRANLFIWLLWNKELKYAFCNQLLKYRFQSNFESCTDVFLYQLKLMSENFKDVTGKIESLICWKS